MSPDTLEYIHAHKTGALIRAAVRVGAMLVGAHDDALAAFTTYGERIGLAFQIVDDVLDVEGSLDTLGKTAGSDQRSSARARPARAGASPRTGSRRRASAWSASSVAVPPSK